VRRKDRHTSPLARIGRGVDHSLRRLRDGRPAPSLQSDGVRFYRFAKWKCRRPIGDWGTSAGTLDKTGTARLPFAGNGDGARHAETGKCNGRRIRSGCQPCPALCDMAASGLCEARKKAGRESRTGAGLVGLMAPVRRRAIRADSSAEIEIAICARPAQAQIARAD
jgi:hypothetical protein